ncbi:hypothetical protein H072_10832 [Dactylellina haptotyla CBS 200.50]|uniref:CHL4-domain-containing protein n=1 Tax=Dactylellina haptotyla (strain CBS 200.50) TaxID=1284197 RepID=S8B9H2_DACHA|nr:hypothetical protein H072_10832 [Dactylellina haptotyla CBS 200.50]
MARSKQPTSLTTRHRLLPSPQLTRHLLRLSKPSLEKLVFDWLKTPICAPDLTPTDEDLQYEDDPRDVTPEEAEEAYKQLDLLDHPSSIKWTACELVLEEGKKPLGDKLPKFQPIVFCRALLDIMGPMVQCHPYYITHPTLPLTLVRLSLHDPFPLPKIPPPPNQIFYIAVPDSSPHLFFTPQRSKLADICRKSLPIALSSQHHRYDIVSTSLSAKTLEALVARKGHDRGNLAAGGGWGVYAVEGEEAVDCSPLERSLPKPKTAKRRSTDAADGDDLLDDEGKERWKRKRIAEGRFGNSALADDGSGLERVEVRLREVWPRRKDLPGTLKMAGGDTVKPTVTDGKGKGRGRPKKQTSSIAKTNDDDDDAPVVDEEFPWKGKSWMPSVDVVLEGTHVFAGLRTLVEQGVLDGEKIPTWMTGEEGMSVGTVKGGTIVPAVMMGIQGPAAGSGKRRGRPSL